MHVYDYIFLSFNSLLRNKLRSILSMIGIVFGVATLVATISIAEGTKQSILKTVENLGTNLVVVVSAPKGNAPGLTYDDKVTIGKLSNTVKRITSFIVRPSVVYGDNISLPVSLMGASGDYPYIRKHGVSAGRFISDDDENSLAKVCVLGAKTAEKMFPNSNPVGQILKMQKGTFLIIGVMEDKGKSFFSGYSNIIFIPVSTMQEYMSLGNKVSQILIESTSSNDVYKTISEVENILLKTHDNFNDFDIWCQEDLLKQKERVMRIFKVALGSIALISLFIGGIGIMNVMLASVNERIKEIGVHKAMGASEQVIMIQFITESLVLSFFGGVIGIVIGIFMGGEIASALRTFLPSSDQQWQAVVTFESVQIAFLFTFVTGFFFGLYPARKASSLDPCEALSYE